MGNKHSEQSQIIKGAQSIGDSYCTNDNVCKNIDSRRSTVDKLVYVCPKAKCLNSRKAGGGKCSCGKGCSRDPYTGLCCSKVEKKRINGELFTFCIEKPYHEGFCSIDTN